MRKHTFSPVDPHVHFPDMEDAILTYWKENRIFEKSIQTRPESRTWTFLDGPPFITGLPHYGTLLSSIPKDVFPRYWTMKGYRVRRVWGWDCHGLPAENKVELTLGIVRKKDIEEKVGVKTFIDACKSYVENVSGEWEWYVDHIGRWVDFTNAYKTMDLPYMETVMWVFKQMYEKEYIYKGLRVSLYCPHCSTPISNFEVAMDADNYRTVTEPATIYKYELSGEKDTYILAWSTTPWNKIATPALAVHPKLTYVKVKQGDEQYILAESTLSQLDERPYTILERFEGKKLVGKSFVPHYDFYTIDKGNRAFVIVSGDFVTALEGTGVVTIAAYGQEDLAVMQREHIQIVLHVDEEGNLKSNVLKWAGMYYLDVNPLVNDDLKSRGLIYRDGKIEHSVPTCWRCHTRLIFAPQNAWYVDVQKLKPILKKTNEAVNWFPSHFKDGRYLKSLESAPDWCISRSRYWGSPVPVWECECGNRFVPGSISELEKKSGVRISDLHKPVIDEITISCDKCGQTTRRVPEVLDSWIEAGSASFAERHYPFEILNQNKILRQAQDDPALKIELDRFFPPDFITEYTGQIRAWFYVLHVIACALFESRAFDNVLVSGVILGTDGRKMSKNFGNYPDPKEMIQKYGGDALRLYLMGSTVMHGEDICISEDQYRMQTRGFLLPLWNIYNFFILHAVPDGWNPDEKEMAKPSKHVLDRWLESRGQSILARITGCLESYDTVEVVKLLEQHVADFSQWYVRRSRDRLGVSQENVQDKRGCFKTYYQALVHVCKMIAPVTPFIAEEMFRNLTGGESVHLEQWPKGYPKRIDTKLEEDMSTVRSIVERIHAKRKELKIPVRQPLAKAQLSNNPILKLSNDLLQLIKEETNIKNIELVIGEGDLEVTLNTRITDELRLEGKVRELTRAIQNARKEKHCALTDTIRLRLPTSYQELPPSSLEALQRETLVTEILWGDTFEVLT